MAVRWVWWAMLIARLMAVTVLPEPTVGEVMASVRQPFSSIFCSTWVRSTS